MKKSVLFLSVCLIGQLTFAQKHPAIVDGAEVSRIIRTLASDEMEGRASFSRGIEKAADFIEGEFRKIGLQPYVDGSYRQTFHVTRITPAAWDVVIDGNNIPSGQVIVSSSNPGINWNSDPHVKLVQIKAGEDFANRFRALTTGQEDALVVIDPSFASLFERYRGFLMRGRMGQLPQAGKPSPSIVMVLGTAVPASFRVNYTNHIEQLPLTNMVGVLPGKSKPDEYVVFSAHYDHIGILKPVDQDSIANGADDDASGTTAVISLAQYYKNRGDNERTLLFVAFTAEEIGLIGSKYFSEQLNPDKIVAMINIEMIGKDSRFGPNTLYVTGFDQSNLATIMQENVKGSAFTFHPDPYPTQNLFYRSDNATLAAAGVPAHSFSTVQIEKDQYYHSVDDEVETLNIENIIASIKAIAIGAQSIVSGKDTPSRVEKLTR